MCSCHPPFTATNQEWTQAAAGAALVSLAAPDSCLTLSAGAVGGTLSTTDSAGNTWCLKDVGGCEGGWIGLPCSEDPDVFQVRESALLGSPRCSLHSPSCAAYQARRAGERPCKLLAATCRVRQRRARLEHAGGAVAPAWHSHAPQASRHAALAPAAGRREWSVAAQPLRRCERGRLHDGPGGPHDSHPSRRLAHE